ncbi:MAG TPA: hypothetical protein VJ063_14490, partial [Verrucomicrobiae bacterium]|nr:hypothetical protein [Verrucomicrobiae bacterium]
GNLIPPLAGTFRMGLGKFLRFDLLSSVLYGGVYVGVGIIFSAEVNTALEMLSEISSGKIALVVALVLILWTAKARSRQKSVAAASAV